MPAGPLQRTAESSAGDVDRELGNSRAQRSVGGAKPFVRHFRRSGNALPRRPPLARVACPLFPWGTVRWSRGCRDDGPGTRTDVRSRAASRVAAGTDESRPNSGSLSST